MKRYLLNTHECGSQRLLVPVFLSPYPPDFLRQGFSLNLELTDVASLAGQGIPSRPLIYLLCFPHGCKGFEVLCLFNKHVFWQPPPQPHLQIVEHSAPRSEVVKLDFELLRYNCGRSALSKQGKDLSVQIWVSAKETALHTQINWTRHVKSHHIFQTLSCYAIVIPPKMFQ